MPMRGEKSQANSPKSSLPATEATEPSKAMECQGIFDYPSWLSSLKQRIREAQVRAAIVVNTELVRLY